MIRVCFVETKATRSAGSQQSLINLIEELKKYDVEPFIVCRTRWELIDVAESMNIKTFVLPSKGLSVPTEGLQLKKYIRYPAKKGYNFFCKKIGCSIFNTKQD